VWSVLITEWIHAQASLGLIYIFFIVFPYYLAILSLNQFPSTFKHPLKTKHLFWIHHD